MVQVTPGVGPTDVRDGAKGWLGDRLYLAEVPQSLLQGSPPRGERLVVRQPGPQPDRAVRRGGILLYGHSLRRQPGQQLCHRIGQFAGEVELDLDPAFHQSIRFPNMSLRASSRLRSCGRASVPMVPANCSKSSRCSLVRLRGISTDRITNWSPRPLRRSRGTPLPLSRITLPDCVPGGMRSSSSPSRVGTLTWAPSVAWATLMERSSRMSSCLRRK